MAQCPAFRCHGHKQPAETRDPKKHSKTPLLYQRDADRHPVLYEPQVLPAHCGHGSLVHLQPKAAIPSTKSGFQGRLICPANPTGTFSVARSSLFPFKGDFSVAGHSLGSVIVFDLLSHQRKTPTITSSGESTEEDEDDDWSLVDGSATAATTANLNSQLASQLAIAANLSSGQLKQVLKVIGGTTGAPMSQSAGVGMPVINYPQLGFVINTCFLLGSPLSIFLTARGIDRLSSDFKLPSCSACVNIFHPFDPVAYRLETMIAPDYRVSLFIVNSYLFCCIRFAIGGCAGIALGGVPGWMLGHRIWSCGPHDSTRVKNEKISAFNLY